MVVAIYYKRESNEEVWQQHGIKSVNGHGYMKPTEHLMYMRINPESVAEWGQLASCVNNLGYEFDFSGQWIKEELRNGFSIMCDRTSDIGDYVEVWLAAENTIKEALKNEIVR